MSKFFGNMKIIQKSMKFSELSWENFDHYSKILPKIFQKFAEIFRKNSYPKLTPIAPVSLLIYLNTLERLRVATLLVLVIKSNCTKREVQLSLRLFYHDPLQHFTEILCSPLCAPPTKYYCNQLLQNTDGISG